MAWEDIEARYYEFLQEHGYIRTEVGSDVLDEYLKYVVPDSDVLDIGCGRGEFLQKVRDKGCRPYGVDIDPQMVERCQQIGLDVTLEDALVFLENSEPDTYDFVFCSNLVEHMRPEDVVRLLSLSYQALRPGGKVLVATPNPESLIVHLYEFWRDATHVRPYNRQLLEFLIWHSGFSLIESSTNSQTAWTSPASTATFDWMVVEPDALDLKDELPDDSDEDESPPEVPVTKAAKISGSVSQVHTVDSELLIDEADEDNEEEDGDLEFSMDEDEEDSDLDSSMDEDENEEDEETDLDSSMDEDEDAAELESLMDEDEDDSDLDSSMGEDEEDGDLDSSMDEDEDDSDLDSSMDEDDEATDPESSIEEEEQEISEEVAEEVAELESLMEEEEQEVYQEAAVPQSSTGADSSEPSDGRIVSRALDEAGIARFQVQMPESEDPEEILKNYRWSQRVFIRRLILQYHQLERSTAESMYRLEQALYNVAGDLENRAVDLNKDLRVFRGDMEYRMNGLRRDLESWTGGLGENIKAVRGDMEQRTDGLGENIKAVRGDMEQRTDGLRHDLESWSTGLGKDLAELRSDTASLRQALETVTGDLRNDVVNWLNGLTRDLKELKADMETRTAGLSSEIQANTLESRQALEHLWDELESRTAHLEKVIQKTSVILGHEIELKTLLVAQKLASTQQTAQDRLYHLEEAIRFLYPHREIFVLGEKPRE